MSQSKLDEVAAVNKTISYKGLYISCDIAIQNCSGYSLAVGSLPWCLHMVPPHYTIAKWKVLLSTFDGRTGKVLCHSKLIIETAGGVY